MWCYMARGSNACNRVDIVKLTPNYATPTCTVLCARISCRMPLLFGSIDGGRFFAIVFFLSLSLAGLSSLIAIMEFPIHVLDDFGSEEITVLVMAQTHACVYKHTHTCTHTHKHTHS